MQDLVIIESPNKIKKIRSYFPGSPRVVATVGHFKDLPADEIGVDLETLKPSFRYAEGKKKMADEMKAAAKGARVYIATDPDREGYAIGMHAYQEIRSGAADVQRIEIREITAKGIEAALKAAVPYTKTNLKTYDAFLGRRVGDRLVGYLLSPIACRELGGRYSVGRVQSPAVRLVVEREREIRAFKPESYWIVYILLNHDGIDFKAFHTAGSIKDEVRAQTILSRITPATLADIMEVEKKETLQHPRPPFTTVDMQAAASSRLRFAPERTMTLAQGLFEAGLCLVPDTLITCASGALLEIREMVGGGTGSPLLGFDVRDGETVVSPAVHSRIEARQEIRYTGEIVRVRLDNGMSVACSPDHGLYCLRDGVSQYISTRNICVGDSVAIQSAAGASRRTWTPSLLEALVVFGVTDINVRMKPNAPSCAALRKALDDYEAQSPNVTLWSRSLKAWYAGQSVFPYPIFPRAGFSPQSIVPEAISVAARKAGSKAIPLTDLDERFWYFVGAMFANGSIDDGFLELERSPRTDAIFMELIDTKFSFSRQYRTAKKIRFHCTLLAELCSRFGIDGDINGRLFALKDSFVHALIAGVAEAGAHLDDQQRIVLLHSQTDPLPRHLEIYLNSIGVATTRHPVQGGIDLLISPENAAAFVEIIRPHVSADLIKILSKVAQVPALSGPAGSADLHAVVANEQAFRWIPVIKLERCPYDGYLYDLTTTTSNFMANGIASHNCTYHRTDSVRIAPEFIDEIRDQIQKTFGDDYIPAAPRNFKSKASQAEAHEAVRPTSMHLPNQCAAIVAKEGLSEDHARLYELLYQRSVASQMASARFDSTTVLFDVSGEEFKATGKVPRFDGFLKLYSDNQDEKAADKEGAEKPVKAESAGAAGEKEDAPPDQALPEMEVGDQVAKKGQGSDKKETKPPRRYTEAGLVKALERLGIGRPSTYASIVKTIKQRAYVTIEKGTLRPSSSGESIVDYLVAKHGWSIDYAMTKGMEDRLDLVEDGKENWVNFAREIKDRVTAYSPVGVPSGGNPAAPSEPQVRFAKDLAARHGEAIPPDVLTTRAKTKVYIDKMLKKPAPKGVEGASSTYTIDPSRPLSEKQRAIIDKNADPETKTKVAAGDFSAGRSFLDVFFGKKDGNGSPVESSPVSGGNMTAGPLFLSEKQRAVIDRNADPETKAKVAAGDLGAGRAFLDRHFGSRSNSPSSSGDKKRKPSAGHKKGKSNKK